MAYLEGKGVDYSDPLLLQAAEEIDRYLAPLNRAFLARLGFATHEDYLRAKAQRTDTAALVEQPQGRVFTLSRWEEDSDKCREEGHGDGGLPEAGGHLSRSPRGAHDDSGLRGAPGPRGERGRGDVSPTLPQQRQAGD